MKEFQLKLKEKYRNQKDKSLIHIVVILYISGEPSQRTFIKLYNIPAYNPVPTKLVHQYSLTCDKRTSGAVLCRNIPW